MSLLVLGNLYLSKKHKAYLSRLVDHVTIIESFEKDISEEILEHRYIFSCNYNLTQHIEQLTHTELVVLAETGIVNIDVEKADRYNINYCNLPTYSENAVVQYILYCMFIGIRPWDRVFDSKFDRNRVIGGESKELGSLTVGIMGFGTIGKKLNKILNGFGCNTLVNRRKKTASPNVNYFTKTELFRESDIVIITCQLNDTTRNIIDSDLLSELHKDAMIISISNKKVFNKDDLYRFMTDNPTINGFFDFDIADEDYKFNTLGNVHISPHLAFYTEETIINRTDACIQRLESYQKSNLEILHN